MAGRRGRPAAAAADSIDDGWGGVSAEEIGVDRNDGWGGLAAAPAGPEAAAQTASLQEEAQRNLLAGAQDGHEEAKMSSVRDKARRYLPAAVGACARARAAVYSADRRVLGGIYDRVSLVPDAGAYSARMALFGAGQGGRARRG
jgi:hypothetical protein